MSYFYEIRSADNTVLKRDGGFASQDAAKMAAREDAKKMKAAPKSERPDVGRILAGGPGYGLPYFRVAQPSPWKAGAHGVFLGPLSRDSL
jgi:hypothetical protein